MKNLNYNNQFFRIVLLTPFFILCSLFYLFSETIQFKSDYSIIFDKVDKPTISITVFIPNNQLHFRIEDTLFSAEVDISVILYKDGEQKQGEIWRKEIFLTDYVATNSSAKGNVWTFSICTEPGKYELHLNVEDINTKIKGERVEKIVVDDIRGKPLWINQPRFYRETDNGKKEWLVSSEMNIEMGDVYTTIKVVSDSAHLSNYIIRYSAIDEKKKTFWSAENEIEVDSIIKEDILLFPTKDFKEGNYTILIELIKDGNIAASNSRKIIINFPFFLSKNYIKRVEEMFYITNKKEMKRLKEAKPEERKKVWNEFWTEKDPIPETPENETSEEYFERVDYANKNFSSFRKGWKSDMGRIYIIYGPADEIEEHPFDTDSPPYQIWYYYAVGKSFVFADLSLTGDYTLIR